MTRDEAIKVTKGFWGNDSGKGVDMLVALGVLKLDEPVGIGIRFDDAMKDLPLHFTLPDIWNAIHAAGLKIVEK